MALKVACCSLAASVRFFTTTREANTSHAPQKRAGLLLSCICATGVCVVGVRGGVVIEAGMGRAFPAPIAPAASERGV